MRLTIRTEATAETIERLRELVLAGGCREIHVPVICDGDPGVRHEWICLHGPSFSAARGGGCVGPAGLEIAWEQMGPCGVASEAVRIADIEYRGPSMAPLDGRHLEIARAVLELAALESSGPVAG